MTNPYVPLHLSSFAGPMIQEIRLYFELKYINTGDSEENIPTAFSTSSLWLRRTWLLWARHLLLC